MTTLRSTPIDDFALAYEVEGDGAAVVLLHGWPGDRTDYRLLRPLLAPHARLVVPDLRGFGESDKHDADPAEQYDAAAQTRSVVGLLDELRIERAVLVGYDVGSRVAQTMSQTCPERIRAMVLAPPMPGVGRRVLEPATQAEFWYQSFHQLDLAEELMDGNPAAIRRYLEHFWQHWSGPDYVPAAADLDALTERYATPGAFRASINWYRAGAGTVAQSLGQEPPAADERVTTPLTVLWSEFDPLFPRDWADGVERYYSHADVVAVDGVGHFAPLEYPATMATAVLDALRR